MTTTVIIANNIYYALTTCLIPDFKCFVWRVTFKPSDPTKTDVIIIIPPFYKWKNEALKDKKQTKTKQNLFKVRNLVNERGPIPTQGMHWLQSQPVATTLPQTEQGKVRAMEHLRIYLGEESCVLLEKDL